MYTEEKKKDKITTFVCFARNPTFPRHSCVSTQPHPTYIVVEKWIKKSFEKLSWCSELSHPILEYEL